MSLVIELDKYLNVYPAGGSTAYYNGSWNGNRPSHRDSTDGILWDTASVTSGLSMAKVLLLLLLETDGKSISIQQHS